MRGWTDFIKTTVVGGIIFLVPFVVVIAILEEAYDIMHFLADPLSDLIPMDTVGHIALANFLTVFMILLFCFAAGLLARSKLAGRFVKELEDRFLSHIPFYNFVKGMTGTIVRTKQDSSVKTVLVRFNDFALIGLEMERTEDGEVVVFLPGAPNPWSGSVRLVAADRVTPVETPILTATHHFEHLGRGLGQMLAKQG